MPCNLTGNETRIPSLMAPSSRGRGQVPCILHHPSPHPCAHTFPNNPCTVPAPHLSWQGELMCHFCLFLTLPSDLVNLASLGAAIAVDCIFFLLIHPHSRPVPSPALNSAMPHWVPIFVYRASSVSSQMGFLPSFYTSRTLFDRGG